MGGSGGGYFSGRVDPSELSRRTRQAEEQAQTDEFETEVSNFLASELAQYNDRDVENIQSVLQTVKDELGTELETSIDLRFGGSIAKHTYVDGLSDVDALVVLDRTDVAGASPAKLKRIFADCFRAHFGRNVVHVGTLAVSLDIRGNWIQLLPAIKEGSGFKIASSDGRGWSKINPGNFAGALTRANEAMNGKLVPTIKLTKAVIATLPEQRRLTGYHVESLAIKIFKDYSGTKIPKAMLHHFFEKAATFVKEPITDSSGQSVHVDEYLGASNSLQRQIVADAMGRIARRIKNADGAGSIEMWRAILGKD